MGKRPYKSPVTNLQAQWMWHGYSPVNTENQLPGYLLVKIGYDLDFADFLSESAAYVALGKALDQVFREAPDVGLIEAARIARHALESCANGAATKSELLNSAMDIKLATARYEGIK